MDDEDLSSPSIRRKIESMSRDIDSIVRLLEQTSFEQIHLDVVEIENRIDSIEEKLGSPTDVNE